ncbi:MAG: hypothetical protein U5K54_05310 [Cytophagales bacterium]|nr:hypothetical protein [Cytophagales bacterium]
MYKIDNYEIPNFNHRNIFNLSRHFIRTRSENPFSDQAILTGGHGALSNKFTTIQGQYANLSEVYGGVFLNRRWMVGLEFAGSTNDIQVPEEYSLNQVTPMTYQYGQGGLMIERVFGSNQTFHFVFNLFTGAGFTLQYDRNSVYDYRYDYETHGYNENWFYGNQGRNWKLISFAGCALVRGFLIEKRMEVRALA